MIPAILGLLISAVCIRLAFPDPARRRLDIYAAAFSVHLLATMSYWVLALADGFDAQFYFTDPLDWADQPFATGSVFMIQFVQATKSVFGGSFFEYFLFFQCFGMIGVALIIRAFGEVAQSLTIVVPGGVWLLALLPGLHLWTVAIGKDAPLFMAVCMSVWAAMRIESRFVWLAVAILIMALVRPHIAAISMLAFATSLLFDRRLPAGAKLLLAIVSAAGLGFVMTTAQSQLGLETLDPQGISEFIERNQNLGQSIAGGEELVNLPYPLKVLSLLFRPFFVDADGILGLVASVENLVLVFLVGSIAVRVRMAIELAKDVFYIGYCMVFSSAVIVLLAFLNYNVGLGLRQKMMAMPGILVVSASLTLYRRYLARAGREDPMAQAPNPLFR